VLATMCLPRQGLGSRDWGLGNEEDFVGAFGAVYRLFLSQRRKGFSLSGGRIEEFLTQRRRGKKNHWLRRLTWLPLII